MAPTSPTGQGQGGGSSSGRPSGSWRRPISGRAVTKVRWRRDGAGSHLADVPELRHQGQRAGGIEASLSRAAGWIRGPGRSTRGWRRGRCHPRVRVLIWGSPPNSGAQLGGQQVLAAQGAQVGAQASEGLPDVLQRGAPGLAWGQGDGDSGRGARPGGLRRAPRPGSPAPAPRSPPALSQISHSAWKALVVSGRRLISCQSEEGGHGGAPTRGRGPPGCGGSPGRASAGRAVGRRCWSGTAG